MDEKQWCNKCYAKGAKVCFKNGIFIPSSKRSFSLFFFEVRMILLFTRTRCGEFNDEIINFSEAIFFYVRRKRLKNFLRQGEMWRY